ncbi:hypothetical protein KZ843_06900 [Pseudomonas aeruginosa]|nr:hypothetical protein [Pseudomonas aeruginosa]MBW6122621.1 hypothetical protein [Pseudomonas aeruginosa]
MSDLAITPRKQRIEIADELVCGMVANGALDPEDETALETACCQAVQDATVLYDAAIEYVS